MERREIEGAISPAMRQAESFQAIARDAVAALERAAQALERAVEENDQLRALLSIDAERGAAVN